MPAFNYQAMDASGATLSGVTQADSERGVRLWLKKQNLIPLEIQAINEQAKSIWQTEVWSARVLSQTQLTLLTRQIAELVNAGLPLERALSALIQECEQERVRDLIAGIRSEVNAGSPLAQALSMHPKEFSSTYCASIASGEQSGHLGTVLERLAKDLERANTLESKVFQALLYPAVVSVIALFIVLFLLGYVVPQVTHVFESSHQELPFLTRIMLVISRFVQQDWWYVLILLACGFWGFREAMKKPAFKENFDARLLKAPLLGPLVRGYNAARFANTLATLVGAGVPILKALQASANTLSNSSMKADMMVALDMVREGASLGLALGQGQKLPGLLPMFARLGEQTGRLGQMLEKAAEQLSSEVERRALQLASLLEPLMIVIMGLMVMLIVLSVMLPIIELNQLVK
jgi:general secretion pathway protein F